MADKKISALSSATVPLAGTEVLPIVQSGATKNVSANGLFNNPTVTNYVEAVVAIGTVQATCFPAFNAFMVCSA